MKEKLRRKSNPYASKGAFYKKVTLIVSREQVFADRSKSFSLAKVTFR